MDIVILTKRGINFQNIKRGEQTVLYLPAPENVKVYKDITSSDSVAERYGSANQIPLWREVQGQAMVYGVLPEILSQRRQAMRVWLPEDFAPPNANSFYFIFGEKWVVHGVQDTDDEGRREWRTTLLKADEATPGSLDAPPVVSLVTSAISDHMLEEGEDRPCIAIYENLTLFDKFQEGLKPLGLQAVPFSSLRPSTKAKPLYKQRDFTMMMSFGVLMALLGVAGTASLWFVNWMESARLEGQIEEIRQQIMNVQINKSIGYIREAEAVLQAMKKTFDAKPSAIMEAASRFGAEFGTLDKVEFRPESVTGEEGGASLYEPGQYMVNVTTSDATNDLLVDQERLAALLLPERPWIRRVQNNPGNSGTLDLSLLLQAELPQPEGGQ
jgi:hypothetical protein